MVHRRPRAQPPRRPRRRGGAQRQGPPVGARPGPEHRRVPRAGGRAGRRGLGERWPASIELPAGATVGTSSARRAGLLAALYPGLRAVPIRGNVDTRLRKLDAGRGRRAPARVRGARPPRARRSAARSASTRGVRPVAGAGCDRARDGHRLGGGTRLCAGRRPRNQDRGDRRARRAHRPRRRLPAAARRLGADRGRPAGAGRGARG